MSATTHGEHFCCQSWWLVHKGIWCSCCTCCKMFNDTPHVIYHCLFTRIREYLLSPLQDCLWAMLCMLEPRYLTRLASTLVCHLAPLQVCSNRVLLFVLSLMMYIVHGKLPEGHEIPTARKLIFKERLFASLLVVTDKVRDMLNLHFMAISRRARSHSVTAQLQLSALRHMLYEYVRALFLVMTQVRDCYWPGGTRRTARDVVDGTVHMTMHFGLPHEHKIEYARSIMVARLIW